jgi:MFS family permease
VQKFLKFKGLSNRELLHLSVAYLLINVGIGMAWPYLPNLIKFLGGGVLAVGMLSILFNITSTVGQFFWGRESDKMGKRKVFVLFGVLSIGIFFLLIGFASSVLMVLLLRTLQGFFVSSQTPAISALVSEFSKEVGSGFAFFNAFSQVGFMLGNFVGGFVSSHFPIKYVYYFSSIPIFLGLAILFFLKEEKKNPEDLRMLMRYYRPGRTFFRWDQAKAFVKRNRNITLFSASIFISMIGSGMVYAYLSLLVGMRFGSSWVGTYFGIDGLISIPLIFIFGHLADKYGSKPILIYGLIGYMATFFLYYSATSIPILIIAAIISGSKWSSYFNSANTYVSRMSMKSERATALGLMNSSMALGWVVGPLLGAYFISFIGLAQTMLVAIIPEIVSLGLVVFIKNDRYFRDGKLIK